jgi:hypothetical protein
MPCRCQNSDPTSHLPAGADGCPVDDVDVVSPLAVGLAILREAIERDGKVHFSLSDLVRGEASMSAIKRLLAVADEPTPETLGRSSAVFVTPTRPALMASSISSSDLLTQLIYERKESHGITPAND